MKGIGSAEIRFYKSPILETFGGHWLNEVIGTTVFDGKFCGQFAKLHCSPGQVCHIYCDCLQTCNTGT